MALDVSVVAGSGRPFLYAPRRVYHWSRHAAWTPRTVKRARRRTPKNENHTRARPRRPSARHGACNRGASEERPWPVSDRSGWPGLRELDPGRTKYFAQIILKPGTRLARGYWNSALAA